MILTEKQYHTFINLSNNSEALLTVCSGSVAILLKALNIAEKCGNTDPRATFTTLYSDSHA